LLLWLIETDVFQMPHLHKHFNVRRYTPTLKRMNRIEFIPLIERATKKDADSEKTPHGNSHTNSIEWNQYQKRELDKNYSNILEPISPGIYQYKLFDIDLEDLQRAINLHIGDTDINDSCSLFGGYAVCVNETIELHPQCCGLLEEIQDWKNILNDDFKDFYLKECHPSPLITRRDDQIIILCKDENETFVPSTTKEKIIIDYQETKSAFLELLKKLTDFSTKLDSLSHNYGTKNISDILIWGNNVNT
jgi:hypothetical protein